ncbi:MAG: hypothetical protein M3Q10_10810 [Chloroflexota bacterium]|nr:hypothetical protein [Chloroflexota bacterium]
MEAEEIADLDALHALDPPARALVLDIVGIFVADALAAASKTEEAEQQAADGLERAEQGISA